MNTLLKSLALAGLFVLGAAQARAATITVAQGRLSGVSLPKADAWLGVPFAAAPVGDLRWKAPTAPKAWTGERKAEAFSPSCMQALATAPGGRPPWTPEFLIPGAVSEDCLYLNIWTPKGAAQAAGSGKRLPVMVWIHGGGFNEGSGSVPIYDGANLAADGGVVVITLNYRVGVFGFLAHPDMAKDGGEIGNFGLADMVAALQWVKANTAAFGGDPAQVTIAGQSAGASAVHALIGAPSAKGLFVRAIAESGSSIAPRATALEPALASGKAFLDSAGAASLADLRKLPAQDVFDKAAAFARTPGNGFRVVVDGTFLPRDPTEAQFTAGAFNDTPVLTGYNANEGSGFSRTYGEWTSADIEAQLAAFKPTSDAARAVYTVSPAGPPAPIEVGKAISRDKGMATSAAWAKKRQSVSRNPIFIYQFNHVEPGPQSAKFGAFHTGEVPYLFQNLIGEGRVFTAEDRQVSKLVSGYWLNFVKSGDPNGAGLPRWPAFTAAAPTIAKLDTTATTGPILPPATLSLYEAHYAAGGAAAGW